MDKKALLVIDVDHFDRWSCKDVKREKERQQVADSIIRRLDWARQKEIPVVFIMIKHPYSRLAQFLRNGRKPALEPVFKKTENDAFSNPKLAEHLHFIGADDLLLVGCNTFVCLAETAKGAVRAGFNVVLLKDAVYPHLSSIDSEKLWIRLVKECASSKNIYVTVSA